MPLGVAAQAPAPPRAPASPGTSSAPAGTDDFARALETAVVAEGVPQPVAPGLPPGPVERGYDDLPVAEPESITAEHSQPADGNDLHPEATIPVDSQQLAALPWPPDGLAGLIGFAEPAGGDADVAAPARGDGRSPDIAPAGLPAARAAASTWMAAPGVQPSGAATTAVPADTSATADSLAAIPLPTEPAVADEAAPAPPAFALPPIAGGTPVAAREPVPVLAAPLPPANVQADDFSERFGAQLQWMAGQKIGHARIQVTPHDLGPVEVRLQMDGDRISAEFFSAHVETRQALEQGLPRLRDLLGEHGFQLAHAGVGTQSDGGTRSGRDGASPTTDTSGSGLESGIPDNIAGRATMGLLDAYA